MKKIKEYKNAKFSAEVWKIAFDMFADRVREENLKISNSVLKVKLREETWCHDNEDEFFADFRKSDYAYALKRADGLELNLASFSFGSTEVEIEAGTRDIIEKFFSIFESNYANSTTPPVTQAKEAPVIFIGHGHSEQWRDLKDHLHDKHGYQIEAYETGARAGHAIRNILDEMSSKASFALLVLTAEDEQKDGTMHARQNVIHETGLFQGKLGFSRAIVLLEEGAKEFSNLQGIAQIRYSKNNIKETFGEVLATLKREFDVVV